jgi:pimeloyl-ACP methyl ester carboxylesterase
MQHLLLLHGAIGAKDQLEPLADHLKEKYAVHAINFGGHGGTPLPDGSFSIPLFANEVLHYLDQKGIKEVSIFGYSMGGYVAMYLAKNNPQVVKKIITLATKFYWDETVAGKETEMLDANTILEKVPAFAKQLERRHFPSDWKILLEKTKEMLMELGKNNTLKIEDYAGISAPCLILLGENDKMITQDETMAVHKALAGSEFKTLPHASHAIEQVNTKTLSALIAEFLK